MGGQFGGIARNPVAPEPARVNGRADMFNAIQSFEFQDHQPLLAQMYRLRARVFSEELGWEVSTSDGQEKDYYDSCNPVYLIWSDRTRRKLYGSLRLLPTTGPTLLYDVFRSTFPDDLNLSAPGIWEGSRLCVNADLIAVDLPDISVRDAFCLMLLALCETALKHGIHTLLSNYETPTRRLYKSAGAPLQELGSSDEFGRRPVCAGLFPVSIENRNRMRQAIGVSGTLLEPDINNRLTRFLNKAA